MIGLCSSVIPAQAGIQRAASVGGQMDSRLRGNDENFGSAAPTAFISE